MVIKIKHYLVDSENVNDNWLMLLELADEKDEMIIFYTKNSPHMSYSSVIKLLQQRRTLQFEECYEGQNALDFQLISYLGYLIGKDEDKTSEFIVMSNDTGFDPAVRYWKQKGFLVNRINVNYCKLTLQRHKEAPSGNIEEELPFTEPAAEESALPAAPVKETSPEKSIDFNKAEVDTFIIRGIAGTVCSRWHVYNRLRLCGAGSAGRAIRPPVPIPVLRRPAWFSTLLAGNPIYRCPHIP